MAAKKINATVETKLWDRFRKKVIDRKLNIKTALTEALDLWIKEGSEQ
jgi:hypothetical protein